MGKTFQRTDRSDQDWYISYYEPGGLRIKRRIGPSKKLAEAALKKIEVAIAEGRYLEVKNQNKIPFEQFADEYLRTHCVNKKSADSYYKLNVRILKSVFKGKSLDDIKPLDIEKFKNARLMQVSPATVNRSLACLKSMFNRAIVWGRYEVSIRQPGSRCAMKRPYGCVTWKKRKSPAWWPIARRISGLL